MTPRPIQHGTISGYMTRDCRCDLCREANRLYHLARRRRLGIPTLAEVHAARRAAVEHGGYQMYSRLKCRCDECREWARLDRAKWRARQKERS